jgi:hypothetical protein
MDELSNIAISGIKSKHDDFIDTVSMLAVMKPYKPTKESGYEYNSRDKMWHVQKEEEIENSSYIF